MALTRRLMFSFLPASAAALLPRSLFAQQPSAAPVFDASEDMYDRISDWISDCEIDTGRSPKRLLLTRAGYKQAMRSNYVEWFYNYGKMERDIPVLFGVVVDVPGTRLSEALAKHPALPETHKQGPISEAAPPGVPVFDAHEDMAGHVIEWCADQSFDGERPDRVYLTRHGYAYANRQNLIDWVPDVEGHMVIPLLLGMRVYISKRAHDADPGS